MLFGKLEKMHYNNLLSFVLTAKISNLTSAGYARNKNYEDHQNCLRNSVIQITIVSFVENIYI